MLVKECICHIAVAAFGMGTWLSVNAVYVELPLLVSFAPEGYDLATYIVLIVQLACLFPLIYGILDSKLASKELWILYNHAILIPIMLFFSGAGLVMAAFVYDRPGVINNSKHSYWLFVAFFIISIPCTTSDVLFMPYITKLENTKYVATFFIGMGFSALVPSAVSLIQGANANLNGTAANPWKPTEGGVLFGPRIFLILMAAICCLSLIGFIVLLKHRNEVSGDDLSKAILQSSSNSICSVELNVIEKDGVRSYDLLESKPPIGVETISTFKWYLLLSISLLLGAVQNSVVPVILPYATQAYGQNIYHLASSLFVMTNPLFCFLQFFIIVKRIPIFVIWTIVCLVFVTFGFVMALLPEKIDWHGMGPLLCVIFALTSGFISWERTAAAHVLRETSSARGLFWCGA
uniref:Riboflavin transporter n=2 Tax=Parascaris TaxID=6254 RepID=A0A915BTR2_PARUN